MSVMNKILFYFKYLTFAGFIYAGIVLYPGLISDNIGIICLVLMIIYIITTFFMFFIKSKQEENNTFNNLVICLLHLYFMFLAYRYVTLSGLELIEPRFFQINYFIASLSIFILTINKLILFLSDNKKGNHKKNLKNNN